MSHFIRPSQLKRTILPAGKQLSDLNISLKHGELLFIKKIADASGGAPLYYLAVGDDPTDVQSAKDCPKFRAYVEEEGPSEDSKIVFGTEVTLPAQYSGGTIKQLYDEHNVNVIPITLAEATFYTPDDGTTWVDVQAKLKEHEALLYGQSQEGLEGRVAAIEMQLRSGVSRVLSQAGQDNENYYLLAVPESGNDVYNGRPRNRTLSAGGIYFNGHTGALMSAAWNSDLAEIRPATDWETFVAGDCVVDTNCGLLYHSFEDLQPNAHIVSDTYGFCMGPENEGAAIALCGEVLAFCETEYCKIKPGDCVCATYCGKVRKMTRREVRRYPDRIVGTVIRIPTEDKWMGKDTCGKILINVK